MSLIQIWFNYVQIASGNDQTGSDRFIERIERSIFLEKAIWVIW